MVALSSLTLLSLAAAGTLAAPTSSQCMTDDQANVVAEKYGDLIAAYTEELADAILTPDFTDWSESVNTLINTCPQGDAAKTLPLPAATFNNREQFEIGQGQQPPINFKQLQLWNACNSVIIRWETTNTANITDVKPVIGLIVMDTVKAPAGSQYPFLITRVFSEFDAGAWLQNLQEAGFCPKTDCGSTTPAPAPGTPVPAPGSPAPAPAQPQPAPANPQPNPAPAPAQPSPETWSASHSAETWTTAVPPPVHTTTTSWGNYSTTPYTTSTKPTTWSRTTPATTSSSSWSTPSTWSHSSSSSSSSWSYSTPSTSSIWSHSKSSSSTWSSSTPVTTVWTTSTKTTSCDEPSSTTWSASKSYGTGNW